jgi:hypothetical protein
MPEEQSIAASATATATSHDTTSRGVNHQYDDVADSPLEFDADQTTSVVAAEVVSALVSSSITVFHFFLCLSFVLFLLYIKM